MKKRGEPVRTRRILLQWLLAVCAIFALALLSSRFRQPLSLDGQIEGPLRNSKEPPLDLVADPVEQVSRAFGNNQPERAHLMGEVLIYDGRGELMAVPRGHVIFHEEGEEDRAAWLNGATWVATVRPGALRVTQLNLNGVLANLRKSEFTIVPGSNSVVLEADIVDGTGLRVVDADTGSDLTGVWVVPARSMEELMLGVPPESAMAGSLARGEDSPIELPRPDGAWTFWIGSPPHYAWRSVTVEGGKPGTLRTIALERGGGFTTRIVGATPEGAAVRIRRRGVPFDHAVRSCKSGGEARFEGLEPGEYYCALTQDDGSIVGETIADVDVDAQTLVEIAIPKRLGRELHGQLAWPLSYEAIAPSISLFRRRLDGSLEELESEPAVWHRQGGNSNWSFGDKPPGSYLLVVQPIQQVVPIVHEKLETSHDIEVPELASVLVHTHGLDSVTDQQFDLLWSCVEGMSSSALRLADDTFEFYCAPGEVKLIWGGLACNCWSEASFKVLAGPNDLVVDVESKPPYSTLEVKIRFLESGIPVPVDIEPWALPEIASPLAGGGEYLGPRGGEVKGLSARFSELHLAFSAPGLYRIKPPVIAGFRPVEPFQLLVPGEGVIEVALVPLP